MAADTKVPPAEQAKVQAIKLVRKVQVKVK